MQIVEALNNAKQQLQSSESAQLDAEVLLSSLLNCERIWLYTYPEQALTEQEKETFNHLITLRSEGHPIAYLTGKKEFWSLTLNVNQDTLIPRPETELLVETVLSLITNDSTKKVLDLGTGTGAIAIAIASERPLVSITATDLSETALNLAKENASLNNIDNINFKTGNWFETFAIDNYDVIVSNPPYICDDDPHLTQGDVRFEPRIALASGQDGLDDLRIIISNAEQYLRPQGWLLLEHGYNQGEQVRELLQQNHFAAVSSIKDYSDIERISIAQRKD